MYALETTTVDRAITKLSNPATRQVFEYWDRLRGERSAPDRREIEPFDISAALGDILMLDMDGGEATVRLAGSRLTTAMAVDPRAQAFQSFWQPTDRRRIGDMLEHAVSCPSGILLKCEMHTVSERKVACEALLLPLRLDGEKIRRLIGAVCFPELPYWLGTETFSHFSIEKSAIFPTQADATLTPRFARSHPIFDRAQPKRRMKHLALYDGGLS
ncbi:MAG: PAS domain-containing protein [Tepidamorphaceae bacterium]|nr:PAS domain-containing protein [Rhodobiaceae bacterium]MCC0048883.1 PAS domain-containing protein [Rhodobiaceae bacterium]